MSSTDVEVASYAAKLIAAMGGPECVSPLMHERITRCAEQRVMAGALRRSMIGGAEVDLSALTALEQMADTSEAALPIPKSTEPKVGKLVIEFVDNGPDQITSLAAELDKAERECRALKAELASLTAAPSRADNVVTLPRSEYTPHPLPKQPPEPPSPWAAIADLTGPVRHPAIYDASDPSGRRRGMT
jgi:hypothetical protein